MKCRPIQSPKPLFILAGFMLACLSAPAQKLPVQSTSKGIDLDRELAEKVEPNRAASYYHFSMAKWLEEKGTVAKTISEMETALKYDPNSAVIHLEIASLLEKSGDAAGAIEHANKAVELDPKDADPHWFLANLYFRSQTRDKSASDGMLKAVQELEKLRDLLPEDERVYYALGGAYFELDQPGKAIQSFEKFQSLSTGIDNGYREIAKYYERNGDLEKAAEYLTRGLKAQPDSIEGLTSLGAILSKLSKNTEAIAIYKKLRDATGGNMAVNRQLASLMIDAGEFNEAYDILSDLNKTTAPDTINRILLGRAQIGLHKYSEAIATLQSVVTADNRVAMETQFYLGRAHEENGNYAEAVKIFAKLLEKTEVNSEESQANRQVFRQHLAANYMEMADYNNAVTVYQDMAKEDSKAYFQLLNAYRISRQFDKALPFGKAQYEKDPNNIPLAIGYARALTDAGKAREGIEILSKLAQANPEDIEVSVNLSQVYLQDKKYSEAEKILIRAETKSADNAGGMERLKFQRAAVYEKQKDFERAESVLKEILKQNPNDAVALNYIGYLLADRGTRLEEAVRYIKEALTLDPRNGAYLDSLGWAYFKLNDMENAEKYLLEADQLVKNDPTIVDHLGDLYYKIGDLTKAQSFWQKSIGIGTEQEDIQKVRRKLEMLQDRLRKQKSAK
jgi:tetratricopeptide (TPR) repeat protein